MKRERFKKYKTCSVAYKLIGTVIGGGYDCRKDKVKLFEGHRTWNEVSYWVDWIRGKLADYNETICSPFI